MMLINPYVFQQPWTPANITTALWLDASDSSTITTVSGAVSQWNDKSANANHVTQSTSSARPTLNTGSLNGLNTLSFNGNQILNSIKNAPIVGNAAFSIYCVYRKSVASAGSFMGGGNSGNSLGAYGFYDDGTSSVWAFAGAQGFYTTSIPINSWLISGFSKSPGPINTTSNAYVNGVNAASGTATTGTPNITQAILRVGQWSNLTTNRLNGNMAELIVIAASTIDSERQKIEGYLAWKWGLTTNLPANHPYKNSSPT